MKTGLSAKSGQRPASGAKCSYPHYPGSVAMILICASLVLLPAGAALYAQGGGLPPGEGKALTEEVCSQCHIPWVIPIIRNGYPGWKGIVDDMVINGAHILPDEAEIISRYLARNFGPDPGNAMKTGRFPDMTNAEKAQLLPAAPGKELVVAYCSSCHDIGIVSALKRTREDWAGVVRDMFTRGPGATPADMQIIIDYLGDQFGAETD